MSLFETLGETIFIDGEGGNRKGEGCFCSLCPSVVFLSQRCARMSKRKGGEKKGEEEFFGGERKGEERRDGPIAIGFPRGEEPLAVKLGREKTRRSFDSSCFFSSCFSPFFP